MSSTTLQSSFTQDIETVYTKKPLVSTQLDESSSDDSVRVPGLGGLRPALCVNPLAPIKQPKEDFEPVPDGILRDARNHPITDCLDDIPEWRNYKKPPSLPESLQKIYAKAHED